MAAIDTIAERLRRRDCGKGPVGLKDDGMLGVLMLLLGMGSPEPSEVCSAPAWMLTRPLKAMCDLRDSSPYGTRTKADVLSATVSKPGGTMTFRWLKDYPLPPEEWDLAAALIGPEGGFVGVDGNIHGVKNIWIMPTTEFGPMLVGTVGMLSVVSNDPTPINRYQR